MTPRTRVLAFTHVTASVGDLMPARELCRMARERGVLTLVDGAQSFGILDIDLGDMQPDFFTGSAHKWPCGPKELGVLFVNRNAQSRVWPSIISLYPGAVGASKTFEALGQRDEAGILAFGEAVRFENRIGLKLIEARGRELARRLIEGLNAIKGVKVWTDPARDRSAAIVSFQPGDLDPSKLATALYRQEHITCNTRGSADRGGIRLSPHLYTLEREVDRAVEAIRHYTSAGL
jgi:isopenicillin-N epimerase